MIDTAYDYTKGAANRRLKLADEEIEQLKEQRDELLEALRIAVEEYRKLPHSLGYEFTHLPAMEAAISKATSK